VDVFGAVLPRGGKDAGECTDDESARGMVGWATLDFPWLHRVDDHKFTAALEAIHALSPGIILSSHLPPAREKIGKYLDLQKMVPSAERFVPLNQEVLNMMIAGIEPLSLWSKR
jgi:hypothetical protein